MVHPSRHRRLGSVVKQVLTANEAMALAATRIEELLQDLSHALEGRSAYDYGSVNLINELRRLAKS